MARTYGDENLGETINYGDPITYNPKEYWVGAGTHQTTLRWPGRQTQEKLLVEFLRGIEFKSVLDLGCAFGRIGMTVMENFDIDRYVGLDVSPDALKKFRGHLDRKEILVRGSPKIDLVESMIEDFKSNEKFDLVISCEVLMHVKPEDLPNVILHTLGYSKKHVINLDYWEPELSVPHLAAHNFLHNYASHYGKCLVTEFPDKQALFYYKHE